VSARQGDAQVDFDADESPGPSFGEDISMDSIEDMSDMELAAGKF